MRRESGRHADRDAKKKRSKKGGKKGRVAGESIRVHNISSVRRRNKGALGWKCDQICKDILDKVETISGHTLLKNEIHLYHETWCDQIVCLYPIQRVFAANCTNSGHTTTMETDSEAGRSHLSLSLSIDIRWAYERPGLPELRKRWATSLTKNRYSPILKFQINSSCV